MTTDQPTFIQPECNWITYKRPLRERAEGGAARGVRRAGRGVRRTGLWTDRGLSGTGRGVIKGGAGVEQGEA